MKSFWLGYQKLCCFWRWSKVNRGMSGGEVSCHDIVQVGLGLWVQAAVRHWHGWGWLWWPGSLLTLRHWDIIHRLWASCPACIRYFGRLPQQTLDSHYPINQQLSYMFSCSLPICVRCWHNESQTPLIWACRRRWREDEDMVYGNEGWVLVIWGQNGACPWPGLSFNRTYAMKDRQQTETHLSFIQIMRLCHRLAVPFNL